MPSGWWLAVLARADLLRASFVPPAKLRKLRLIARERQNLIRQLAQEKSVAQDFHQQRYATRRGGQ